MTDKKFIDQLLIKKKIPPALKELWNFFDDITHIPRSSGHEEKMREYIVAFAHTHKWNCSVDEAGNVLVEIPASIGYKHSPGIILQTHMDMVCLGIPDPAEFGVLPRIDTEWVKATGTTLGADNGIGLATSLAIAQEKIEHGPLALLFTKDEEVGMTGALHLGFANTLSKYRYLLNLDSEGEGIATFSSAGGIQSHIDLPKNTVKIMNKTLVKITVSGLLGGHSGDSIHEGRLTSIRILSSVLSYTLQTVESADIVSVKAGVRKNVIPSEGEVILAVDDQQVEHVKNAVSYVKQQTLSQSKIIEEQKFGIEIEILSEGLDSNALPTETSKNLVALLTNLPHGVIKWDTNVPDLVETSTNLAVIETEESSIHIYLLSRSSVNTELTSLSEHIRGIGQKHGATVAESAHFPGWQANPKNPLIPILTQVWEQQTGKQLRVQAVHAGLECGILVDTYKNLDAISIGPTILGAHSTDERVSIDSVSRFYSFVLGIIEHIAKK
jgi:dipeptidase D